MDAVIDSVMKLVVDSPNIALWVLVIIYGFKVVIVGSIYGVVRFAIDKAHSAYVNERPPRVITTQVNYQYEGHLFNDAKPSFKALLDCLSKTYVGNSGTYITKENVDKLIQLMHTNNFNVGDK